MYNNYLIHYGVPGRSGKQGAGLWYKDGQLTEAGYEHYYGIRRRSNNSKDDQSSNQKKGIGKKIAIGAGVALAVAAAAGAVIAFNKSTKLRDAMRSEAYDTGQQWMWTKFNAQLKYLNSRDEAKLDRHALKTGKYYKESTSSEDIPNLRKLAMRNSIEAQRNMQLARMAKTKEKEYKNIAATLTRRGAIRKKIEEIINEERAHDKFIEEAIKNRQKSYLTRYHRN